ncbi:hypothetical protein AXF42_Ash016766 [Apostasia shenzhenica]|uniref:Uncharacterized protein n=1 Tax=Apostasia shenzhenica TaxID=1088818 RepID=A0A2I0AQ98_9ASPA|nr:hypothetical protein AXF42_Ash016766 [Apostasia shenzhenica]
MELRSTAGTERIPDQEILECRGNGEETPIHHHSSLLITDEIDSACSTPFVSAPSSPGRVHGGVGYFFSAPASPVHYVLSSPAYSVSPSSISGGSIATQSDGSIAGSFEFEFSAKYAAIPGSGVGAVGSMSSADELFLNGQIRPMKLSSHLKHSQVLAPLLDADEEENADEMGEPCERSRDLRMRSRSIHRRTRSMSPLRNAPLQWRDEGNEEDRNSAKEEVKDPGNEAEALTPSGSASSSRSSSSGRNSKRWVFLKDLLYRSKSEGRANAKEKFWHSISFSPAKEKSKPPSTSPAHPQNTESSQKQCKKIGKYFSTSSAQSSKKSGCSSSSAQPKPVNGVGKRRAPAPSAHERLYTTNRAQAEEMRRRTFLPYRQGLLGCLGFSSRGYGAMNGLAKTLNPVSSR